ncbi:MULTISPECIES: hypothetical protein [Enterobacter]|uniref:hypothetical protein n=1 Tax=Enterobacter TaxID=547 RepID=UPI0019096FFA|nr:MULTISPECIES: hypothetical protein [Enterobacter]MBO4150934.1 hypothetical protein [Enterobacter kobei]UOY64475.1 hypothetical protein LCD42_11850 [Enterobacter kobei]
MDNSTKEPPSDTRSSELKKKLRTKLLQNIFWGVCTLIVILLLAYILILSFGSSIKSLINEYQNFVIPVISVVTVLLSSMLLTIFLKGPSKSISTNDPLISKLAELIPFFGNALKLAALILKTPLIFEDNTKDIEKSAGFDQEYYKKSVKNRLMAKLVIGASAELKNDITRFSSEKYLDDLYASTKKRLLDEIESQTTKGIFSLSLGVITASIGMIILASSAFGETSDNFRLFIVHYFPKLSIAIVIEVFAYFFLRLYKQSLDEIKYFQNELTNIEMKYFSVMVVKREPDETALVNIANELMKTERNYILEKGQSTVFLERDRLYSEQQKEAWKTISNLTEKLSKQELK